MKFRSVLSIALIVATLVLDCAAYAAKVRIRTPGGKKGNKGDEPAAKFDKNNNGRIDSDEAADVQAAFEKDKTGPLQKYDTNRNGNLEKGEIASIQITAHRK